MEVGRKEKLFKRTAIFGFQQRIENSVLAATGTPRVQYIATTRS
jgi:hypothetical protein